MMCGDCSMMCCDWYTLWWL